MTSLIITCEHAGNDVPRRYAHLFHDKEVLNSHRGWDPGALSIAEFIKSRTNAPLFSCKITRLLIELNRSLTSPSLFSEFSNELLDDEKVTLTNDIYLTYRDGVEAMIEQMEKPVLHFSIHTFTPVFNGTVRTTDFGILFDPTRGYENVVAEKLKLELKSSLPELTIDVNKPYAGVDDGFTTYLREKFADAHYAGIEIEINQKFIGTENIKRVQSSLADSILRLDD